MAIRRGTFDATEFVPAIGDVADVIVVGAGPSGAVYAKYLSSFGFHVVCLEQGDWVGTAEYTGNRVEYEASMYGTWHKSSRVRNGSGDYPLVAEDVDVDPVMFNAVGGGSIHYGAQWPRHLPSDFRVRTLDGVAEDWPLTYEDLEPYYERNDVDFAVSGMAGDPAYPDGAAPPYPALPINNFGRRVAEGFNKLGYSWWPAPNAIAQGNSNGLVPCVRYGTCEAGCPNGSKASVDITHWPAALRNGATLVTGAGVSSVTVDERDRATGVVFADRNGRQSRLRGSIVVLAANGIGTPRLLLTSATAGHPDGLANSSGLVGRNLMLHPTAMAVGVYADDMQSWRGPAGQNIHSYEFYETDPARGFVRGAKWLSMPTAGPLVTTEYVPRDTIATTEQMLHTVRRMLGRSVLLVVLTEDLPDPNNRVTLDSDVVDAHGVPAPRVRYRRDDNNRALMAWHLDKAKEVLEASGATDVFLHDVMPDQPGHLLGTARMGADPASSVTDPFGATHDIANLWIADGSLFVTSGAVNPTNTIAALALRGATELVRLAAEREVAS